MPEHVRQDEVADLRPSQVDLLKVGNLSVFACDGNTLKHGIHVVLAVHQVPTVHLSSLELACDCVADALVQQLHRNANGVHVVCLRTPLLGNEQLYDATTSTRP
eukprot:CAMPEP_0178448656 /NCGR_PEP_ID=MMETSP0689_2-20121128/42110_1 /TAXON_ID=160604 /ORGANISM="Amphidinium massartii, Strain CS-259" /LENGTH=103 /DNA_ID=CAMNT_0020073875 /DNA_START=178 /DNA_END=489 /DNA_ORIENTATION=-